MKKFEIRKIAKSKKVLDANSKTVNSNKRKSVKFMIMWHLSFCNRDFHVLQSTSTNHQALKENISIWINWMISSAESM